MRLMALKLVLKKIGVANNLVVLVYDKSEEAFSVGTKSDIISDDVQEMSFYSTQNDNKEDDYALINYIVIYRN